MERKYFGTQSAILRNIVSLVIAVTVSIYMGFIYNVLNGPNSDFKAIFMDFNNYGVYEIFTGEASYGFHSFTLRLYTYTKSAWQDVAVLYSGD